MSAVDVASTVGQAVVVADTASLERADWLELRRRGIGGSDAAAICGQSRYRSPLKVWLDKTGALDDDHDNEAMEWGRRLEPIVADATAERTGLTFAEMPVLLASPERDWQLANVDRFAVDKHGDWSVAEIKTAGHWAGSEWDDGAVPDAYLLQGCHYLAVTGLPRVIFGVLIGGQRLEVRTVERDEELIEHLTTIEAEFWQRVLNLTPPDPDGSKATTDLLAHLYDVKPGSILTVDDLDRVRHHLDERAYEKQAEAYHAERAAMHENALKALIGEHEVAKDHDGRVLFTWKQSKVHRLDTKSLRAAEPELADAHTTTTTQRRFHAPKAKEA